MLIATKLHPPSPRPQQVVRQHLLTRLQAALTYPLTLLSAPAGFGKTTLMADFRWRIITRTIAVSGMLPVEEAARVAQPQFGWLSLDEGDNDPIRFWTYVAMTFETVWPGIGQPVVDALQAVATQSHPLSTSLEALLTLLINRLAQREEHLVLVLDDYHAIHTVLIHDTLQFFLEHQPSNLHLILLTRSDPPLSLARWRVRGQLLELRTADLRFTLEETDAFLQQTMQLPLAPPQVAQLEAHTEGWIAGLQLAALSLQGRSDCADLINSFTGSHRFVLDYLVDEVLQQQSTDVQQFLLQTSILDRFCAPLCDAIMGDEELATKNAVPLPMASLPAQGLLNRLDRANLFLIPLDEAREWWRYHHLFADVLSCRLQETQPAIVPELHRRAAGWFAQHNLLPEAIHHALTAADFALAAARSPACRTRRLCA